MEFFPFRFGKSGPNFPWKYLCIGWGHNFHLEIWKKFAKTKNTDWRVLYSFFFPLPKNCQKGNYLKKLAKIPCLFHKRVAKFHPNCLVLGEVTIVLSTSVTCLLGYWSCAKVSPPKSELGILGTVAALPNWKSKLVHSPIEPMIEWIF